MPPEARGILVTGDFIRDHHIYEGHRLDYGDEVSPGVNVVAETGGATLVHELLSRLLPGKEWTSFVDVEVPECPNRSQEAHAFWRPFPPGEPRERQYWRVSEAMGFGAIGTREVCKPWPRSGTPLPSPRILVVSEGGMGFRQYRACWEHLPFADARWIVLKTAAPFASDDLWRELDAKYREKMVVVASARELRKSTARLQAGLSWEETVEGVVRELQGDGALAPLARHGHLIVAFESEGGLWIDSTPAGDGPARSEVGREAHLVYDAAAIEGDHARNVEGQAFGLLSCLTASVVRQIALDEGHPDFAAALEGGLCAMRDLLEKGHGPATVPPKGFPAERLAEVVRNPPYRYSRARFRLQRPRLSEGGSRLAPGVGEPGWSILRETQRSREPAYELARLVVLRGLIALENLPHLRIERLVSADRREVEALRSLAQVVHAYKNGAAGRKPLSIGVFGPPGAGKSFAVEEICARFIDKKKAGWMEFNLSQFSGPEDLIGAFHQIRDRVLQGLLPVAFFDEFDSQKYRWLRYLLAPMQDGRFQEGRLTHTLRDSIFVFAGGTCWTYASFGPPRSPGGGESDAEEAFRLRKGPDFKSRLDAYLDVVGPNRRPVPATSPDGAVTVAGHHFKEDLDDVDFPLRRALMIRTALKCKPEQRLDMDEGLLHALLYAKRFFHGARSLAKVLEPFVAAGPGPLRRSLLPPTTRLEMHTDAAFPALCGSQSPRSAPVSSLSREDVEIVAKLFHETDRALDRKEGRRDPKTDKDIDDLEDHFKESSRAASKRMPGVLALAGLRLVPGLSSPEEERAVRQHLEYHLELMAEEEHEGWMDWYIKNNWRYAKARDDDKRLHDCLLPFGQLDHAQRDKDRNSVRHYPDFAARAEKKIDFAPG